MSRTSLGFALCLLPLMLACGDSEPSQPPDEDPANSLVIRNPAIDLSQYKLVTVEERRNHPDAGEPEYVYLIGGVDAVKVPGPNLESSDTLFRLEGEQIQIHPQPTFESSPYTFRVVVNPRLVYEIRISDYDREVGLAQITLVRDGPTLRSEFIINGDPTQNGVAHAMVIKPFVDGGAGTPSAPVSIESR